MVVGLALAANTQISSLSTIFVTHLLTSPQLPSLVALNSSRLASAYEMLVAFLKKHMIPYIPCNAGLYVLARLAPDAQSWADEAAMATKCKDAGVLLSPGRAYHGPEDAKGWMRIGFSVETSVLQEALRRLESVLVVLPIGVADAGSESRKRKLPAAEIDDRGGDNLDAHCVKKAASNVMEQSQEPIKAS